MPDQLLNPDRHGLKIPNLRRLVAEGAYATGVKGVLPTVTYPSHTTMITGVSPAKHGILANTPFDPFGKNLDGWYWYAEDIKAETLWDVLRKCRHDDRQRRMARQRRRSYRFQHRSILARGVCLKTSKPFARSRRRGC